MIRQAYIRKFRGTASTSFTTGSFTYTSSIDSSITNLAADYMYDTGFTARPIIVLMHGYAENIAHILTGTRQRFASRGFFVLIVGMRGRNSASGSRDASGREVMDIIDAVEYVKNNATLSAQIDSSRVVIAGYSGGGGNAIACLAKAPDYWNYAVSHFGPSDYGWRNDTGWYYTNAGFQASLTTDVGATPTAQPGWWRSRNHADALGYQLALAPKGNKILSLYHDASDGSVGVAHSDRISTVLSNSSLSELLDYHRSTASDSTRYLHGYPEDSSGVLSAESDWWITAINSRQWKVPVSGTILVPGWIQTKRFSIWLGLTSGNANPKIDSSGGKVHCVRVIYNTLNSTFKVMPLTGTVRIRIEFGALTSTQDISDETIITVT